MDVLERYLRAVKFWLPKSERSDIALELSEDIRSEIEHREASLGRPLTASEVRALLQERGNPLSLAQRYLPERYVIGPALYPLYALVLRSVILFYALPWLCVWLALRVFWPESQATASMGPMFGLWSLLQIVAFQFAAITLIFAAVERSNAASALVESIVPRDVPAMRRNDRNRIPRANSVLEALFNLAFLSWWLGLVRFPALPDATISPAPFVMQYLYWPLALLFAAGAAVAIVNALAPEWSPRRALARLCVDLLGIAVLLAVVAAWPFVRVAGHGAEIGMLVINWSLAITIGLVVLSMAVRAVLDIQRIRGHAAPDNWLVFTLAGE